LTAFAEHTHEHPRQAHPVLGLLGVCFLAGFGWIVATQGPLAPVKVTVGTSSEASIERTLFGIATVEARRSHAIGPTLAGRVARVLVDQGDAVKAGQLLAEMEPVDLDARLAAGAASAAAAAQRVTAADAALAEVGGRAQLAKNSAERYADLRRRNFVSQEAADAKSHEVGRAGSAPVRRGHAGGSEGRPAARAIGSSPAPDRIAPICASSARWMASSPRAWPSPARRWWPARR
jgi:HlyD family secretion protein